MADILIRGMEMPKYTTKAEFGIDADGNPLCMVHHRGGTEPGIYDVVPLPEGHGRLIDADVIVEWLMKCAKNPPDNDQESRWFYLFAAEIAKSCATIVPAEGGTDK